MTEKGGRRGQRRNILNENEDFPEAKQGKAKEGQGGKKGVVVYLKEKEKEKEKEEKEKEKTHLPSPTAPE